MSDTCKMLYIEILFDVSNNKPKFNHMHVKLFLNANMLYVCIKYYTVQVTNLYTDASDSQNNHNQVY